jgi:hypothetical protein
MIIPFASACAKVSSVISFAIEIEKGAVTSPPPTVKRTTTQAICLAPSPASIPPPAGSARVGNIASRRVMRIVVRQSLSRPPPAG